MDTSDGDIVFDENGVCHYCLKTEDLLKSLPQTDDVASQLLNETVNEIKEYGRNKEYDCLLGISGGVDSSYVAYLAHKHGLKPLVVHFDNGWNSELAVENINRIVDKCGWDLSTYVIDWPEFRDLQRAFFKASVIDIELLTDHAIKASMYKIAKKNNIKYILAGDNTALESFLPRSWNWRKFDLRNIKAIQKRFGQKKLKTFPTMGYFKQRWYKAFTDFKFVPILNKTRFINDDAIKTLEDEFGWKYYGGKHYESLFTKFYQAYVLPQKFGVDKRRAHLSSLIRCGQLSKDEALKKLSKKLYDELTLQNEKTYVLKKLGFSDDEFEKIMTTPVKRHDEYPSDVVLIAKVKKIFGPLAKILRK
jgi:N-acetyl sugar amidotransferase